MEKSIRLPKGKEQKSVIGLLEKEIETYEAEIEQYRKEHQTDSPIGVEAATRPLMHIINIYERLARKGIVTYEEMRDGVQKSDVNGIYHAFIQAKLRYDSLSRRKTT